MPKIGRKVIVIAGAGLATLFIVAAACGAKWETSVTPAAPVTNSLPTSGRVYHPGDSMATVQPPTTYIPFSVAPATRAPSGPATTVSDGTYEVGPDIVAGKYKATCPAFGYWARLKNNDGSVSDIIANNVVGANGGPMTFTAKKGEYVEVRNCTFTKTG